MSEQIILNSKNIAFSRSDIGLLRKKLSADIELYLFDTFQFNDYLSAFEEIISDSELDRANKFVFERDRTSYIICHGIVRCILGRKLILSPNRIVFKKEANEKPTLPENSLFFNLSHARNLGALGFSLTGNLGVDIEKPDPTVEYEGIISKFFTSTEQDFIRNSADSTESFYMLWTRKEAVLKSTGKGITTHLRDFSVTNGKNSTLAKHITITGHKPKIVSLNIRTHIFEDKIVSLASPNSCQISFVELAKEHITHFLD